MKEKIVLIGAGSALFTRGLVADMIRQDWETELMLVDIDPVALEASAGLARKMINLKKARIKLVATTDRREVMSGATVVISTIGVGGRRAWEQDVFVPRKYGIFQTVGDTVMPGGTSRALRMIPATVEIAKDVLDLCPGALFFNYANPMAVVCQAVRQATGVDNMIGLCHGVNHVGQYLANALGDPQDQVRYTAVGMNHLTWFTEFRTGGRDRMGRLREIARERLASLVPDSAPQIAGGNAREDEIFGKEDNRFSWQMLDLFGAFPAVMDHHSTEFFPHLFARKGGYYGRTLGVDVFPFERVISYGDKIYEEMKDEGLSPSPLSQEYYARISGEHEQVTDIIRSIRHDRGDVYSANVVNRGQIPDLPEGIIVECPVAAYANGLQPVGIHRLGPGLTGTLASRMHWVETTARAALTGDRELFIQALLIDGSVSSVTMARDLAEDLLETHREHLPQFFGTEAPRRKSVPPAVATPV
ncbi:MAG: hypothetical protein SFY92_02310 [Verrucomicrobiae bacterium]|nr:hypothetical protein [Verrucomicrobiae bacterium]